MLKRTLLTTLTAAGMLAFAASAKAAYLTLGTTNTSNAPTTVSGNTAGSELLVKNTNGSSASAFGLYGLLTAASPTVSATAVRGQNSSTNGRGYGVYGSQGGSGTGVRGFAPGGNGVWGSSTSGIGVRGQSVSGTGVFGVHSATSGGEPGVRGDNYSTAPSNGVEGHAASSGGSGVFGVNTGGGYGVAGSSSSGRGAAGFSDSWQGVYGHSKTNAGVVGESDVFDGVWGQAHSGAHAGVSGHNDADGYAVWGGTSGSGVAIYGTSPNGRGVHGDSPGGTGVYGTGYTGVIGISPAYLGVYGESSSYIGVFGRENGSDTGYGIAGESASGKAVYGLSTSGYAGWFQGKVNITGGCTGCTGPSALQIDDPLDPARKYLQHSSVASSQQLDVYSGNVTTNAKGFATVRMPAYFQALNRSFRYQLTIVGRSFARAIIWKEVAHNRFTIRTDQPNVKVSWLVTGVRHDRYAKAHPVQVVAPKAKKDQGKYLHPELYRQPKSDAIGYRKPPRIPRAARSTPKH